MIYCLPEGDPCHTRLVKGSAGSEAHPHSSPRRTISISLVAKAYNTVQAGTRIGPASESGMPPRALLPEG